MSAEEQVEAVKAVLVALRSQEVPYTEAVHDSHVLLDTVKHERSVKVLQPRPRPGMYVCATECGAERVEITGWEVGVCAPSCVQS